MTLLFTIDGPVATVTLNRPEALNSIDAEMRAALVAAWDRIKRERGL